MSSPIKRELLSAIGTETTDKLAEIKTRIATLGKLIKLQKPERKHEASRYKSRADKKEKPE
jgi:hypothetical protein